MDMRSHGSNTISAMIREDALGLLSQWIGDERYADLSDLGALDVVVGIDRRAE